MIHSMTGYASVARELPEGVLNLELRAVNHRFLDIQLRMPEELRFVEPSLREIFAGKLARGKLECRLNWTQAPAAVASLEINEALTRRLGALNRQVQALLPDSEGLRVVDVLRWPGVLAANALPLDAMRDLCLALTRSALDEFNAFRAREGERLKTFLLDRVTQIETLVATVAPRMPQVLAAYQEKLATRLREAVGNADDERIRQELTLFMTRSDVDEELSRLNTHLTEVRRVLERGGTVGKRLDFLMQELNREANTLGSKAADDGISQTAVELKVLIEQMREQVQNIE